MTTKSQASYAELEYPQYPIIPKVSGVGTLCSHPHTELLWVSCLHENGPGTRELADQSFSAADARDDATASNALHNVFAVPSDEVPVVDDVFLTIHELSPMSAAAHHLHSEPLAYIFSQDSTKA